jgi:hypothetical protein
MSGRDNRLEFSFLSMLVEDEALFSIMTHQTHIGVALKTRDGHGLVLNGLHQDHLYTTRHTAHRSYSVNSARLVLS